MNRVRSNRTVGSSFFHGKNRIEGMKLDPIIETPCMVTGLWRRFAVHLFEGKLPLDEMETL